MKFWKIIYITIILIAAGITYILIEPTRTIFDKIKCVSLSSRQLFNASTHNSDKGRITLKVIEKCQQTKHKKDFTAKCYHFHKKKYE